MNKVLHITPHLGGGVGRALAGVVAAHRMTGSIWQHEIACLEIPEKTEILQELQGLNCPVHVAPDHAGLAALIEAAHVVQVEWWHHPVLFQYLCTAPLPPMRLMIWCHVNGLNTPLIPAELLPLASRVLFTSGCTLEAQNLTEKLQGRMDDVGVIHSCAGFSHIPSVPRLSSDPLQAGYLGSLNLSKLHPDFIKFLAAVKVPDFQVSVYGDGLNLETLQRQAEQWDCREAFQYKGFTKEPAKVLAGINVMPYLLNPAHYGTTENALLEAMAAGVVPVVLDHPVERSLVEDKVTGLVVSTPDEFGRAMEFLWENPDQRHRMSEAAAQGVRQRFSPELTASAFDKQLDSMLQKPKKEVPFSRALGSTASQWFLVGMDNPDVFQGDAPLPPATSHRRHAYHEQTKGSVAHFHGVFAKDRDLARWAGRLQNHPLPFFPCPICQSDDRDSLLHLKTGNLDGSPLYPEVRLVCCQTCGHVHNTISQTELDGLFKYYNQEYAPINLKVSKGNEDPLSTARYNLLFSCLEDRLKPSHSILDVGCATGGFLTFLQKRGFSQLAGVDMLDNYVQQARRLTSFPIELGLAEALPYKDDSFDCLVLEQVMEHLINPAVAFHQAGRVLRPGGIMCVGVPDASRYGESHFFDYYWVLLREHLQHFDSNHLQQLAHQEGFELLEFRQTFHRIMSDKMVMPILYGVFRWTGKNQISTQVTGDQTELKLSMAKYLQVEADRLKERRLLVEQLIQDQVPVYAWGVGREFGYLHGAAGLSGCPLEGLIDLNQLKQEKHTVGGVAVSPMEVLSHAPANAVLLVTAVAHSDSVVKAAKEMGFPGRIITF